MSQAQEVLQAELVMLTKRAVGQQKLVNESKAAMDVSIGQGLPTLVKTARNRWLRQKAAYDETMLAIGEVDAALRKVAPDLFKDATIVDPAPKGRK